jgi:hypothetical protein
VSKFLARLSQCLLAYSVFSEPSSTPCPSKAARFVSFRPSSPERSAGQVEQISILQSSQAQSPTRRSPGRESLTLSRPFLRGASTLPQASQIWRKGVWSVQAEYVGISHRVKEAEATEYSLQEAYVSFPEGLLNIFPVGRGDRIQHQADLVVHHVLCFTLRIDLNHSPRA